MGKIDKMSITVTREQLAKIEGPSTGATMLPPAR
jgi:hypothetical protein